MYIGIYECWSYSKNVIIKTVDSVKHLFRQISGGDYFLIILLGATVYFLAASMEIASDSSLLRLCYFLFSVFESSSGFLYKLTR